MDEQAFLAMMREHQGIIHKVCRLYRNSDEDRKDLFQEVTYQLWKAFPSFKGTAKLSTWMYRIALNTAIASYRKKRPNVEYQPILPDLAEEEQSDELAMRQERLLNALKQLNDSEKAIIALYFEDFSYRQISEVIGISENNLGVKLSRIKQKIQKLLTK